MNPTPWMTRDQLARAQGISKPTISRLASTGGSSGGWRYEARPITDADRGRLGDYNSHLQTVCRAVPVDPDLETYVLCDIVCGRLIVDWHDTDLERVRNRVRPMHGYVAGDSPPTAILKVRGEPPGEGNRIRLSDWKEDTLEVVESDRPIELPWGIHSPSETHTEKETDVSTAQKVEEVEQEVELDADGWTPWMTKADMVDVVNMASSAVYTAIKEGRTCGDWEFETRPVDERDEGKDLHWNVKELCRARVAEEEAEQFERAIDPRLGVEVGDIVVSLSNGHRYIVLGPNDFEGPGFDVISVEPIGPDGERIEGVLLAGEYRLAESDSNKVDKLAAALKGAMDENARLRDELAGLRRGLRNFGRSSPKPRRTATSARTTGKPPTTNYATCSSRSCRAGT